MSFFKRFKREDEPTTAAWLASVARDELYRQFSKLRRVYPPDYADLVVVFELPAKKIELTAKLEEARLKPANEARIKELLTELGNLARSSVR
jgi:hypothetical protein